MTYQIEVTDTFSGEANYCWVRRGTTQGETRRAKIAAVRRLAGWHVSIRVDCSDYGDMLEVRPRGICQIAFVIWSDAQ